MPVRIALRRSAALGALPVLLAVLLAQLAFRDRSWTYEWTWALFQQGFATVLAGPIIAGTAAWEGSRLAKAADTVGTAPRNWRLFASHWLGLAFWATVAYLASLSVAVVMVIARGTPWGPRVVDLLSVAAPVGLLAFEAAAGLVLGWLMGHRLISAPLAAIGCFCVTLILYMNGPSQFVDVGGATGSLAGLTPKVQVQLAQVVFFVAASSAVMLWAGRTPYRRVRRPLAAPVLSTCALVAATAALFAAGGTDVVRRDEPVECVGEAPQICTTAGYRRYAQAAHDGLRPYVVALSDVGATPVPTRFVQGGSTGLVTTGPLGNDFVSGHTEKAVNLIVAAYVSKPCFSKSDKSVDRAMSGLQWWLSQHGPDKYEDPTLPRDLVNGTPAQQASFIRAAVRLLSKCSSGK